MQRIAESFQIDAFEVVDEVAVQTLVVSRRGLAIEPEACIGQYGVEGATNDYVMQDSPEQINSPRDEK